MKVKLLEGHPDAGREMDCPVWIAENLIKQGHAAAVDPSQRLPDPRRPAKDSALAKISAARKADEEPGENKDEGDAPGNKGAQNLSKARPRGRRKGRGRR